MKDRKVRMLIMENLPSTRDGQVSKLFLRLAVQQDASSFNEDISDEQFDKNLSWLNSNQCLVVFQDKYVQATSAGLYGFGIIKKY